MAATCDRNEKFPSDEVLDIADETIEGHGTIREIIGAMPNCFPIMPGWNCMLRIYLPQKPHFDGAWKLPPWKRVE